MLQRCLVLIVVVHFTGGNAQDGDDAGVCMGASCEDAGRVTGSGLLQSGHTVDTVTGKASEDASKKQKQFRFIVSATNAGLRGMWDVHRVKFLTKSGDEIGPSTEGCDAISSGYYPSPHYAPEQAFLDNSGFWGGRPWGKPFWRTYFYIGVGCDVDHKITRVQLKQTHNNHAPMVYVFKEYELLAEESLVTLDTIWEAGVKAPLTLKPEPEPESESESQSESESEMPAGPA